MNRIFVLWNLKIIGILIIACFALFLPVKTFAQTPTLSTQNTVKSQPVTESASPQSLPFNTNPDVPRNLHTYTQSVFIDILSTASCFLTGTDPINQSNKCLGMDAKTGKLDYTNQNSGGLLLTMGNLIGKTYNIPISTAGYTNYLAGNFGLSQDTYAASGLGKGIGFVGLTPVLKIWVVLRNLSYLVFVFIFILLGLGIMFRVNIDARTVMSIQNQIPKIVIGLVLITLSYAIAGFLIDMMYVATYLIIHVFNSQGLATVTNISGNPITAVGFLSGGFHNLAGPPASSVGGIVASLFEGNIGNVLSMIVTTVIGTMIGGGIGVPLGGLIGGALGALTGFLFGDTIIKLISTVIVYLIIVIAVFSALFRVWFMLIKAYIFILLDVIFAPFWIMVGILPFGSGGFGPWIRSLVANLAAFPVVLTLFMIGKSIQENIKPNEGNFMPPLVGNLGGDSTAAVGSIIGLGLILIMPEAVNITKSVLKAPEMKLATAAGRAIGVGQAVIGKPVSGIKGELFGKDVMGAPKPGSEWMAKRFGGLGRALTGGGLKDKTGNTPFFKKPSLGWRGAKLESGKRERGIFGKLSTEAKTQREEVSKMRAEAIRIKDSHDYKVNPGGYEEHEKHGQTFLRKKPLPGEGDLGEQAGGPARPPQGPPPADGPEVAGAERTEGTEPVEGAETNPGEPGEQGAETVEQAAERGAFKGARRGVGSADIGQDVEEGLKREREEEEKRRSGGGTPPSTPA